MKKLYDWDTWFSRKRFKLRKGVEFTCSVISMAQQVRSAASERKVHVSIIDEDGAILVEVSPPKKEGASNA